MSEPTPITPPPVEAAPAEVVASPQAPLAAKERNEVFLGGMVVAIICLLLLILAGTFGYFGYRLWQSAQIERTTPSIQELGEKPVTDMPQVAAPTPVAEPTPAPAPAPSADLAAVEVKVLNGGAAKGSASTLVDLLKKAGYTKASFGNSVANHTGTTIYYTITSQSAAETLKATVAKTYPAVTVAPAKAGDKDATAAAIVVVLGGS